MEWWWSKRYRTYGGDPVSINVAEQLNIKPKDLDRYLKYKEGSFVQKISDPGSKNDGKLGQGYTKFDNRQ
jgi:hypothetical protein